LGWTRAAVFWLRCLSFLGYAGLGGKFNKPVPDWGLEAAKTATPANAKDASAVILFDEYVETVDDKGRATEREREAIRILKPQGRQRMREFPSMWMRR
jgi:hypothetical protein